jgi:hypothetical protein
MVSKAPKIFFFVAQTQLIHFIVQKIKEIVNRDCFSLVLFIFIFIFIVSVGRNLLNAVGLNHIYFLVLTIGVDCICSHIISIYESMICTLQYIYVVLYRMQELFILYINCLSMYTTYYTCMELTAHSAQYNT